MRGRLIHATVSARARELQKLEFAQPRQAVATPSLGVLSDSWGVNQVFGIRPTATPSLHGLWKIRADGTAVMAAPFPPFFQSLIHDVALDRRGNVYVSTACAERFGGSASTGGSISGATAIFWRDRSTRCLGSLRRQWSRLSPGGAVWGFESLIQPRKCLVIVSEGERDELSDPQRVNERLRSRVLTPVSQGFGRRSSLIVSCCELLAECSGRFPPGW
jgi:hypothetical protein